jgi:predicted TIM-barrel fold metal-dependent hydrolase
MARNIVRDDMKYRDAPPGYPIIDVDVHESFTSLHDLLPYIGEPWKSLLERKGHWHGFAPPFISWGSGGGVRLDSRPQSGGPAGSDFGLMREQLLDTYDIRVAVLTGAFYPGMLGEMQVEAAAAMAASYNDYQVDQWLGQHESLRGSIHVAPQDPQAAAHEIDRLGHHPQMLQIMLPVGGPVRPYGDPFYSPIFEAAERNELVVATHHTAYAEGVYGMGRYYIERHTLIPQATMAQVISLMFNGVFDRFPNLKVVCLEGGFTWLPHLLWRMDREYKSVRQEVPWVKKLPSHHIVRDGRLKLSTQPTEDLTADELMKVIDLIGSDEVLVYSSDYPHFDFDSPVRSLPARLPGEMKRKILYENAQSLYDLRDAC